MITSDATAVHHWQDEIAGHRWAYAFGKPVRLLTIAVTGVRCRFPDGHIERMHPNYIELPERTVNSRG